MKSWIKQKVDSVIRHEKTPDEKNVNALQNMIDNLGNDNENVLEIIEFFMTNFHDNYNIIIKKWKLEKYINILANYVIESYLEKKKDSESLQLYINFLLISLDYHINDQKTNNNFYLFINKMLKTNSVNIQESESELISKILNTKALCDYLYSNERLANIWETVFVTNENSCLIFSNLFINSMSEYHLKDEDIEYFKHKIIQNPNFFDISERRVTSSLQFISYTVKYTEDKELIKSLCDIILQNVKKITNYSFLDSFFHNFSTETWNLIDNIINHEDVNQNIIKSLISTIYNANVIPPDSFSYNAFILYYKEFPTSTKDLLFSIVSKTTFQSIYKFILTCLPIENSSVEIDRISKLVISNKTREFIDEQLVSLFLEFSDKDNTKQLLENNIHYYKMIVNLVDQMDFNSGVTDIMFCKLIEIILNECDIANNILIKLCKNTNPSLYMKSFINYLEKDMITEQIFQSLYVVLLSVDSFSHEFRLKGGCNYLGNVVKYSNGLNLLSIMVLNGPFKEVDDFIEKEFENTKLKDLDQKSLIKLMCACHQTSDKHGLIMIPSLLPHVEDWNFHTPFDQYIAGSYLTSKPIKLTNTHLSKFIGRFITPQLIKTVIKNPFLLSCATDVTLHHTSLYQFHHNTRSSKCYIKKCNSMSFWIFVQDCHKYTDLFYFGNDIFGIAPGFFRYKNTDVEFHDKSWYLISIVQRGISKKSEVYVNTKKVGESIISSNIIYIGSETDNNATWYLSSNIHTSNKEFDINDIENMFREGYLKPSHNKVNIISGVRFVPYKGILRFLDSAGGANFIFLEMIKCTNKEEFLLLIQSALSLLTLKMIQRDFFFNSMRYVIERRPDLYDNQAENILFLAFNTKTGLDLRSLYYMFCDYKFISLENIHLNYITKLIDSHNKFDDITAGDILEKLFDFAMDVFIFFNVSEYLYENFFLLIETLAEKMPSLLPKILLVIEGLPNIDTDAVTSFENNSNYSKQEKLMSILLKNNKNFYKYIPSSSGFLFISLVNQSLGSMMFNYLADLCTQYTDYFTVDAFITAMHFYRTNIAEESTWINLFTFLTSKRLDCLSHYMEITACRTDLYSHLIILLCDLFPKEIPNFNQDCLSHKIIQILYSYILATNVQLKTLLKPIQRLCTFGYGGHDATQLPLPNISNLKTSVSKKMSKPHKVVNKGDVSLQSCKDSVKLLSKDLYSKTLKSVKVSLDFEMHDEVNNDVHLLPPENIDEFLSSPTIQLICLIVYKVFAEFNDDISSFKKALYYLTVFSADVLPFIAIRMHKIIIYYLLESYINQNNEIILGLIFEFLVYRVIEGWWDDEIEKLLNMIITLKFFPKKIESLIIAIIYRLNGENIYASLATIISSPFFDLFKNNIDFLNSFLYSIVMLKNLNDEVLKPLLLLIHQNLPQCDISTMIENNTINGYITENVDKLSLLYKTIMDDSDRSYGELENYRMSSMNETSVVRVSESKEILNIQQTYIKRCIRFQFFLRLNMSNLLINNSISSLFKYSSREDQTNDQSKHYMINFASHPLCVPQKLVPSSFYYEISISKGKKLDSKSMPKSSHKSSYKSIIKSLDDEHFAAKCLDGWNLPSFVQVGLSTCAEIHFSTTSPLFSCSILMSTELLRCVAAINDVSINLIMHADISNDDIVSDNLSYSLCHYALVESCLKGFIGESSLFCNHPVITIKFDEICNIFPRKYLHEDNSVDIYTISGFSYTLVLPKDYRKKLLSKFKPNKNAIAIPCINNVVYMTLDQVTKLWVSGRLSTLIYLLYLNYSSGRSFNDFSQYPVVPWVISDYTSTDGPKTFRNLYLPMGMQSPERAEKYIAVFEETDPHYHYGTHYSHPAGVLHFLMRLEPYTLFNVMLHGGFDHKDRLFCDIGEAWRSASFSSQADVKELIPQAYVVPYIYYNINNLPLTERTDGHDLVNVKLPDWGKTPAKFVYKMRTHLESNETSKGIPSWIDLIFGYKSRGQAAIQAFNVFHPLTYGMHNYMESVAVIDAINNFGQCPSQLFKDPHPMHDDIIRLNILNSSTRYVQIKNIGSNIESIIILRNNLITHKSLSHTSPYFRFTILDGYFNIDDRFVEYCTFLFDVTSSSISRDLLLLSISNDSGFINNYYISNTSPHFRLLSSCVSHGVSFKVVKISSYYGIVYAASVNVIYLFDAFSGLLLQKNDVGEKVTHIAIDEIHGLIIVATDKKIAIYSINIDFYTSTDVPSTITCISVTDSLIWNEVPIFVTGHSDGSILVWSIEDYVCKYKTLMKVFTTQVSCLKLFSDDQALIAVDSEGDTYLLSIQKNNQKLISRKHFDKCYICLDNKATIRCKNCSFPICKNCVGNSKTCILCNNTELKTGAESEESRIQV